MMETLGTSERICLVWPGISTPDKFALTLFSNGKVTWFINDQCYGKDLKPKDAVGHLECLLGWQHEACELLQSFFKARGLSCQ